ncbi:uncharacterized protein [Rutidosis leptorrhynchoides]|uniref:uncharacterized protein n=1 Tax=Rutidosis leptorrhynchoides TaxID=125765 RepID=UPI003A9A3334
MANVVVHVRIVTTLSFIRSKWLKHTYIVMVLADVIRHGSGTVNKSLIERVIPSTTDQLHDLLTDVRQESHSMDTDEITNAPSDTDALSDKDELDELAILEQTELYPGCDSMSSFNFLANLMHVKVANKWSNTSFDQLLALLNSAFPHAKIPSSHYESKKTMRKIGLGYESIHVCKNDCCLFWKENENKDRCPVCNESRWKDKNTNGRKVAHKVLRYFPLTPRLKRLYSSRHTAKDMTWHATGKCTENGKMRHPVDGTTWKDFDTRYPDFAREPRNVRLGLSADGFNPFGNTNSSYSMWPVILTTYNLPPWLCMKESTFMLTLLIPGPKSPGKDIDIFLRPLIDELKVLWSDGVTTKDHATNSYFNMRAILLFTINDFPARSSLSGWSGQGYMACPTCNVDTPSKRALTKIIYIGHRMYLSIKNKLRFSKSFDGKNETRRPPRRRTNDEILKQLENAPDPDPGKYGGKKRKRDSTVEGNWSKKLIFYELEYWSSVELKHNLDVMHIEKNVCESLLNTLLMNKEKSKDTLTARKVLEEWGIRKELWLKPLGNGKSLKPHPKYSFSSADRNEFCKFIRQVKLPDGFGSNFKNKVIENYTKIAGLKSHDHHIMMQHLLPVGVRAYLDTSISTPIIELCLFFKQLCARTLMMSDMEDAKVKLINILCSLEQIFPPSFFDIMIHLVMHLPEEAIQGGPVYMRWMYLFERYMKKLKNYVRNKARPEGSIAEGYVADEALTYASRYLHNVQTRFNKPDKNADAPIPCREYYVFQSVCTPISKCVEKLVDRTHQTKIDWFVLNNSSEIDNYKNEFKDEMPRGTNIEKEFPEWFKNKIKRLRVADESQCGNELFSLANGPLHINSYTACIVNGVRWFKTDKNGRIIKNNLTNISTQHEWYKEDPYLLATQKNLVFYLDDPSKRKGGSSKYWKVVQEVHHRNTWDRDILGADNELDLIHGSTSSDIRLSANLEPLPQTNLSRYETTVDDDDMLGTENDNADEDNEETDEDVTEVAVEDMTRVEEVDEDADETDWATDDDEDSDHDSVHYISD